MWIILVPFEWPVRFDKRLWLQFGNIIISSSLSLVVHLDAEWKKIMRSLHIFDDVVQHCSMGLVVLLHTAGCHNTKFSKGAAKAQFSRIRVGLAGGGLIGRNFISPAI